MMYRSPSDHFGIVAEIGLSFPYPNEDSPIKFAPLFVDKKNKFEA